MPLSDMAIRHARPTDKNYTIGDFDGLSLMVTAAGKKRWLFRFYWEGQQTKMSFGSYPAVSLKQAREWRDDARKLLAQNINPCEHRKQQRLEAEDEAKHTFQAVYDEWINFRRLSLNEGCQSTLSQILRVFKKGRPAHPGRAPHQKHHPPRPAGHPQHHRATQSFHHG